MIVIDSNVFAKLFVEEVDSAQARAFFKHCIAQKIPLFAPTLFSYEVLQIAIYYNYPLEKALELIDRHVAFNLTLVELNKVDWLAIEKMVRSGHEKSGFPSLYDSSYHVLALSRTNMFLTADKKHVTKTRQFGSVRLLEQWEEMLGM